MKKFIILFCLLGSSLVYPSDVVRRMFDMALGQEQENPELAEKLASTLYPILNEKDKDDAAFEFGVLFDKNPSDSASAGYSFKSSDLQGRIEEVADLTRQAKDVVKRNNGDWQPVADAAKL